MAEEHKHDCCSAEGTGACCRGGRGGKFIFLSLAVICLAGIVVVSILRDRIVSQQYRQVTVNGQGRVSYQPDIALITLGVQIDKTPKAEDALSQLNGKVNAIIAAVKAAEVAPENIQTQNYSVMPQYDYKDNVTVVGGYSANQQLTIKLTDYDKNPNHLNQIIAVASKAGANQILNLAFDASNMNDLKQQARVKAIADAKAKSGALADAADVELKEISGWWENVVQPQPYYGYVGGADGKGGMGGAVSPQAPSGSREVIIEIGVTYNLE